jgi:hypothetical protein
MCAGGVVCAGAVVCASGDVFRSIATSPGNGMGSGCDGTLVEPRDDHEATCDDVEA